MQWWLWLLVGLALAALAVALATFALRSVKLPAAARRIVALSWRRKLRLLRLVFADRRVPLRAKIVLPAFLLYLALPIDVIPDFIPVVGHLDDVLLAAVALVVLVRAIPAEVMEEHLARVEMTGHRAEGGD